MAKHIIHISELEGARHFATLLEGLAVGEEIIIEDDSRPIAIVHSAPNIRRTVSECIALAKTHEQELGEASVLDSDFADDMRDIIEQRQT